LVRAFFIIFLTFICWAAWANVRADRVLSFSEWKDRQVVSAINRQVRAANQLRLLRIQGSIPDRDKERQWISELIRLGSAVETTKSLSLEDYFLVYLKPLGAEGAPLRRAAKRLSTEQVEELIRLMIRDREVEAERTSYNFRSSI
jgi:hypothetical protein